MVQLKIDWISNSNKTESLSALHRVNKFANEIVCGDVARSEADNSKVFNKRCIIHSNALRGGKIMVSYAVSDYVLFFFVK